MNAKDKTKVPVFLEERNGYDFLGHSMQACKAEEAEFFLVLENGDKLMKGLDGLYIKSHGCLYEQVLKMDRFKSVQFVEVNGSTKPITRKLIKA